MTVNPVTFALVTVAMVVCDVCWAMYFIEVEARRAARAGLWSAAIMVAGTFTVRNYVANPWYILAACLGAFIGTAATVWHKRRKMGGFT